MLATRGDATLPQNLLGTSQRDVATEIPLGEASARRSNFEFEKSNSVKVQILIVEDHPNSREQLERCLTRRDYDVATAEDLRTGIDCVARQQFDAIISDIALPDGSGYMLINEARRRGSRALGIAVSGYPYPFDVDEPGVTGFDYHLPKPVDCERLCSLLKQSRAPAGIPGIVEGFVERLVAGKTDCVSGARDLGLALRNVGLSCSEQWLNDVLELNSWLRRSWRHYDWERRQPIILIRWPAQEFCRVAPWPMHRNWLERWTKAGGRIYDGKMIALKDDPVWQELSDFGFPFPPFALNSRMGIRSIHHDRAMKLGLLRGDRQVSPKQIPRPELILLSQAPPEKS